MAAVAEGQKMPGRPKKQDPSGRLEITASKEWLKRVKEAAERLDLNPPAFVRMVVSLYLDKQERVQKPEGKS
jgi:hypothetical protein